MSRFEVVPETLVASAAAAGQVGAGIGALVGHAAGLSAEGAPDATGAALESFAAQAGRHVAALSDAVTGLGSATSAAAGLYTRTDERAMR